MSGLVRGALVGPRLHPAIARRAGSTAAELADLAIARYPGRVALVADRGLLVAERLAGMAAG